MKFQLKRKLNGYQVDSDNMSIAEIKWSKIFDTQYVIIISEGKEQYRILKNNSIFNILDEKGEQVEATYQFSTEIKSQYSPSIPLIKEVIIKDWKIIIKILYLENKGIILFDNMDVGTIEDISTKLPIINLSKGTSFNPNINIVLFILSYYAICDSNLDIIV